MADGSATADNALAVARDVLKRAPLIDGHNDLALGDPGRQRGAGRRHRL